MGRKQGSFWIFRTCPNTGLAWTHLGPRSTEAVSVSPATGRDWDLRNQQPAEVAERHWYFSAATLLLPEPVTQVTACCTLPKE